MFLIPEEDELNRNDRNSVVVFGKIYIRFERPAYLNFKGKFMMLVDPSISS